MSKPLATVGDKFLYVDGQATTAGWVEETVEVKCIEVTDNYCLSGYTFYLFAKVDGTPYLYGGNTRGEYGMTLAYKRMD